MTGLTAKQARALRACVEPQSAAGRMFWAAARASWPGPRKTLGSLEARGLVEYHDPPREDGRSWPATPAGDLELKAYDDTIHWERTPTGYKSTDGRAEVYRVTGGRYSFSIDGQAYTGAFTMRSARAVAQSEWRRRRKTEAAARS